MYVTKHTHLTDLIVFKTVFCFVLFCVSCLVLLLTKIQRLQSARKTNPRWAPAKAMLDCHNNTIGSGMGPTLQSTPR